MEIKVNKFDDTLCIKAIGNAKLENSLKESKIIITKPKNKFSLKERFAAYKGPNLAKEFEWDEPRGREVK